MRHGDHDLAETGPDSESLSLSSLCDSIYSYDILILYYHLLSLHMEQDQWVGLVWLGGEGDSFDVCSTFVFKVQSDSGSIHICSYGH